MNAPFCACVVAVLFLGCFILIIDKRTPIFDTSTTLIYIKLYSSIDNWLQLCCFILNVKLLLNPALGRYELNILPILSTLHT